MLLRKVCACYFFLRLPSKSLFRPQIEKSVPCHIRGFFLTYPRCWLEAAPPLLAIFVGSFYYFTVIFIGRLCFSRTQFQRTQTEWLRKASLYVRIGFWNLWGKLLALFFWLLEHSSIHKTSCHKCKYFLRHGSSLLLVHGRLYYMNCLCNYICLAFQILLMEP